MLKQLSEILDSNSKRKYLALAFLSVASSLLQTAGVAAISLFFTVLLGGKLPGPVQHFVDEQSFVALGVVVFIAAVSGTVSSGLATYYGIRISWEQYEKIAGCLLGQYLRNPYEWHLQQNSAGLINAVLTEVRELCVVLQHGVLVVVRGTELLALTILLVAVKPMVALVAFSSFGCVYWGLYQVNRSHIRGQGRIVVQANEERQKAVAESLSGIKAVKVSGNAPYFQQRFAVAAHRMANSTADIQCFSSMPRYFIEAILFGGLVGFVVLSHVRGWGVYESVSLVALYGAAALRMLPAAQQLYLSVVSIVAYQAVVEKVAEGLNAQVSRNDKADISAADAADSLYELTDISYRYPTGEQPSLRGLSLAITRGEKIGVVGTTGAGKTTLVDILLQLLHPSEGKLSIAASEMERGHLVAYVPQQLHFLDDTIAANIAWGIPEEKRDLAQVKLAAQKAQIHEHIATLSESYDTLMGEQGARLSGGQRQRIGIARALYLDPALLVLDEASNALDPETERQVLEGLFEQDLTLLVIAHRLSTLRKCTRILVMREGEIVSEGTYDQLLENCDFFKKMADADVGKVAAL